MIPRVFGKAGTPIVLEGSAYDFGQSVVAVEFTLDEGAHWTRYDTPGATDYQNVNWSFEWTPPEPGFYVMKIRSINEEGKHSPESARVEIEVE